MKITLAAISLSSRRRHEPAGLLVDEYLKRASQYAACSLQLFPTEDSLLAGLNKQTGRSPARLILLDSAGESLTSREFATYVGKLRDTGAQQLVTAIGPPDGWSPQAHLRADLLLSFGAMTLPHTLAQAVLAEQIYRALTILAGHPYHCGH